MNQDGASGSEGAFDEIYGGGEVAEEVGVLGVEDFDDFVVEVFGEGGEASGCDGEDVSDAELA